MAHRHRRTPGPRRSMRSRWPTPPGPERRGRHCHMPAVLSCTTLLHPPDRWQCVGYTVPVVHPPDSGSHLPRLRADGAAPPLPDSPREGSRRGPHHRSAAQTCRLGHFFGGHALQDPGALLGHTRRGPSAGCAPLEGNREHVGCAQQRSSVSPEASTAGPTPSRITGGRSATSPLSDHEQGAPSTGSVIRPEAAHTPHGMRGLRCCCGSTGPVSAATAAGSCLARPAPDPALPPPVRGRWHRRVVPRAVSRREWPGEGRSRRCCRACPRRSLGRPGSHPTSVPCAVRGTGTHRHGRGSRPASRSRRCRR